MTDAYYFWDQTGGVANVLCGGTPAIGATVLHVSSSGAVGQAQAVTEATAVLAGQL